MNNTKRRKENLKLNGYVLASILVTRDTAHFERSLLNADARLNAIQIIQYHNTERKRRDKNRIQKEEKNWK